MIKIHSKIRVSELGDTAKRLATLQKETTEVKDDAFLKENFATLSTMQEQMTEALKRDKAVSLLDEADTKRDESVRILGKVLEGYKLIPLENLNQHGKKLHQVFEKYGVKITVASYSEESNLIDALLMDLSANDLKESISALSGVAEAIAQLKKDQQNFEKIRAEYNKKLVEQQASQNATSYRKPMLNLINGTIATYLSAMKLVNPTQYTNFINEANKIIAGINEVIKGRLNKKIGEK